MNNLIVRVIYSTFLFHPVQETIQAELNQVIVLNSMEDSKSVVLSSSNNDSFAIWVPVEIV